MTIGISFPAYFRSPSTVPSLNSKGRRLVIGVSDKKEILGIDNDLKLGFAL